MAKSLAKGDYDGIRAEVRKVMKQPDYDDGELFPPHEEEKKANLDSVSKGSAGPVLVR